MPASAAATSLLLTTPERGRRMKQNLNGFAGIVRELADDALNTGPWSVTVYAICVATP